MPSPTIAGFPALTREGGPSAAALGEGTLSLRVVVRTPTVETFVQRYSRFVKDDRIFIFTKSEQPPGTRLRFTLELVDGRPLVTGEGTVTRVRGDTGDPNRPPGMELAFIPTDEASRKIVQLMLDERLSRGPKTASLTAPPVPPSLQLPALPQTGAFATIDSLAAMRPEKKAPEPHASKMHVAVTPSPSTGIPTPSIGSRRLEPPQRNSGPLTPLKVERALTLATLAGPDPADAIKPTIELSPVEPSVEVAAGIEIDVPADPVPELEPDPDPVPPVSNVSRLTESTVAALFDMGAPPEPPAALDWSLPEPAKPVPPPRDEPSVIANVLEPPSRSKLDPGSLFATGDGYLPTPSPDHTPLPVHAPPIVDPHDEMSHSFPGLAAAPAFAEGWRSTELDPDAVPANPFSEVSDNAIEYFVEWSLERSTGATKAVDRAPAAFGTIAMKPPEPEPPADRGMRFGLVVGLAIGAIVGGATAWFAKPAPAAITAPAHPVVAAVTTPPTPSPSPSLPPSTSHSPSASPPPSHPPPPSPPQSQFAIQSHPSGATVTIDGKPEGKTPLTLPLPAGPHDVLVKLDRYADYEATVDSPGTLDAQLHRPRGTLKITSSPPGADVVVGGDSRGKTPAEVALPAYESYTVAVSLNGKSWQRKVYVKPPSTSVQAQLASHVLPTRAQGRPNDVRSAGIR